MEKIIPTVAVVILEKESVLLVRHEEGAKHLTGTYGLPAGRVEEGETLEQAAIRELKEETGLQADSLERMPTVHEATIERKDGAKKFSLVSFKCSDYSGELNTSLETVPEWISFSKLEKVNLLPNVDKIISEAIEM